MWERGYCGLTPYVVHEVATFHFHVHFPGMVLPTKILSLVTYCYTTDLHRCDRLFCTAPTIGMIYAPVLP